MQEEGCAPPPLQDTLAIISSTSSLGHLNARGDSRSGLSTDIDMVWAGLSAGEGLQVLKGDFSPLLPCQYIMLDIALGKGGSLYTGATLPDLSSMVTPGDPVIYRLFPRLVCQESLWLLSPVSCQISFFIILRGWIYRVRSQTHLSPLYRCSVSDWENAGLDRAIPPSQTKSASF